MLLVVDPWPEGLPSPFATPASSQPPPTLDQDEDARKRKAASQAATGLTTKRSREGIPANATPPPQQPQSPRPTTSADPRPAADPSMDRPKGQGRRERQRKRGQAAGASSSMPPPSAPEATKFPASSSNLRLTSLSDDSTIPLLDVQPDVVPSPRHPDATTLWSKSRAGREAQVSQDDSIAGPAAALASAQAEGANQDPLNASMLDLLESCSHLLDDAAQQYILQQRSKRAATPRGSGARSEDSKSSQADPGGPSTQPRSSSGGIQQASPAVDTAVQKKLNDLESLVEQQNDTLLAVVQERDNAAQQLMQEQSHSRDLAQLLICKVCRTAKRDTVLLPCMHMTLCNECVQRQALAQLICPACSSPASGYQTILLVP